MSQDGNDAVREVPRPATARDPGPAGTVAAWRGEEVGRPLEGRRRRLLRARQPGGLGAAAGGAGRLLRRAGRRAAAGGVRTPRPASSAAPRLILDLERLQELPASDAAPLARYTATLQAQRGDYNGRVMSIRHEDLRSLAVIYDDRPAHLAERLASWGVLNTDDRTIDLT